MQEFLDLCLKSVGLQINHLPKGVVHSSFLRDNHTVYYTAKLSNGKMTFLLPETQNRSRQRYPYVTGIQVSVEEIFL